MNEDPGAPNYDPEHKIIRSLFNGSRGPLLRKATALDWAGDPIEVENRFRPRHGERTYAARCSTTSRTTTTSSATTRRTCSRPRWP